MADSKRLRRIEIERQRQLLNKQVERPANQVDIEPEYPEEVKDSSFWQDFHRSYDATNNLWNNAIASYQIHTGQELWSDLSDDESGIPWNALSVDERRARFDAIQRKKFFEEHGITLAQYKSQDGTAGGMLGSVAKMLADPTALFPVSRVLTTTYKGMALLGASFGGADSLARQYVEEGRISKEEFVMDTAKGLAGGLLFKGVVDIPTGYRYATSGRHVTAGTKPLKSNAKVRDLVKYEKKQERAVTEIHETLMEDVLMGKPVDEAIEGVTAKFSITKDMYKKLMEDTNNVIYPTVRDAENYFINSMKQVHTRGRPETGTFVSRSFIPIEERIMNISPRVAGILRKLEFDTHKKMIDMESTAIRWIDMKASLGARSSELIERGLWKQDWNGITKIINNSSASAKLKDDLLITMDKIRSNFNTLGDEAINVGMFKQADLIPDYYPTKIRDKDGLLAIIKATNPDTKELRALLAKADNDPIFEANLLNSFMRRGKGTKEPNPSFIFDRKFKTVPSDYRVTKKQFDSLSIDKKLQEKFTVTKRDSAGNPTEFSINLRDEFYWKPDDALRIYFRQMNDEIGIRKLFGRNFTVKKPNQIASHMSNQNIEDSIGKLVRDQRVVGNLTDSEIKALQHLLKVRFVHARQPSTRSTRVAKDIVYATMLGNPVSAMTQLGDLGTAIYKSNITSFARSVVGRTASLPGKLTRMAANKFRKANNQLDVNEGMLIDVEADLGISQAAFEMDTREGLAKITNRALKLGFMQVDKIGKNTIIESSLRKSAKALRGSEKARAEFIKKYAPFYGADDAEAMMTSLIKVGDAIKRNKLNLNKTQKIKEHIDNNVRMFLFHQLADVQPILLTSMPENFHTGKFGIKMLYVLQSFTLKQLSVVRTEVLKEIQRGNVRQGAANLVRYLGFMGMFNFGAEQMKEFTRTGDTSKLVPNSDEILPGLVSGMVKMYGFDPYFLRETSMEGPAGAAAGRIIPQAPIVNVLGATDPLFNAAYNLYAEENDKKVKDDIGLYNAVGLMPFFGSLLTSDWMEEPYRAINADPLAEMVRHKAGRRMERETREREADSPRVRAKAAKEARKHNITRPRRIEEQYRQRLKNARG